MRSSRCGSCPGLLASLARLLLLSVCGAVPMARAQTVNVSGRPLVLIAQSGRADTVAGFINRFGRAQSVGDSVWFVTRDFSTVGGVYSGRGGTASVVRVAGPGSAGPSGPLQVFHDAFVAGTADTAPVLAAGAARVDSLVSAGTDPLGGVLAPGAILPNSGDRVANAFGEPNLVDGKLAVIAWHALEGGNGVDFRGVYRVESGALVTVADTATGLPGGFGIPDTFSSQVGWDGSVLAFWASRGPSGESEALFAWDADAGMRRVLGNGDAIPGGGVVDGVISPPVVDGGVVYFYAYETDGRTHLLRYRAGAVERLAGDGDATPDGGVLDNTGHIGLAVEDGRVWFPAITSGGAALYTLDDGVLNTVIAPGTRILGIRPDTFVVQDVAGDTVVLLATLGSTEYLLANLTAPAPPVITVDPVEATVAVGATAEFRVTALGAEPLAYYWTRGATVFPQTDSPILTLPSASAADIGYYQVVVSNAFGRAFSRSALLNVEAGPEFLSQLPPVTVEFGDRLLLAPQVLGGLPMTFRWTRDGAPVDTQPAGSAVFSRTSAVLADSGVYRVAVSNAWGEAVSDPIQVTVQPPPPNPAFGGRRLAPVVSSGTVLPGTGEPFDTTTLSEFSARWLGDDVLVVGRGPGPTPAGLFVWTAGGLQMRLPLGIELPNGLGPAVDYGLPEGTVASDPLIVTASRPGDFGPTAVGVYRENGGILERLIDNAMDAPGTPGTPIGFLAGLSQGGGAVLVASKAGTLPGLYLAGSGAPNRLISGGDTLPVVGTDILQFQGIGLEGEMYVAVAASSGLAKQVALVGQTSGGLTPILAKDEPVPGTGQTVRTFGPSGLRDGVVYLMVFDSGFARHVVSWADGTFTHLAGPGMEVAGLGTIQAVESSFPKIAGGRVYLAARVTTPTGVIQAVVAAGPGGIEPVIATPKLDGQRATYGVVAVEPDRLMVMAYFESGQRALYANVGEAVGPGAPVLDFERLDGGRIRFVVPDGHSLETAPTPFSGWEPLPGGGTVEVGTADGERYFRLRAN